MAGSRAERRRERGTDRKKRAEEERMTKWQEVELRREEIEDMTESREEKRRE